MRNKKGGLITGLVLPAFLGALLACATDPAPFQIADSLPPEELAYYNDAFDRMREDLWDKGGYINLQEQMQNFKMAAMRFENGKLIIRTKTGSFSKGGLSTKYEFRGDFDIQLDCRIDFIKSTTGMDQLLNIMVVDKRGKIGKTDTVVINLTMGELMYQGWLSSGVIKNGRWNKGSSKLMENFDGTFRILRKGRHISALYKTKGASKWSKMHTFPATDKDMIFGFQLRNYFTQRTTIEATQSISAEFDNFRINAAHEIIEEEI